jgi:putative salt-induced outer membrane protein YdiY
MSSLYRRSFSKGWFFQNSLGYRVDNIKGIDHEIKESIGGGYKFKLLKDKVEINIGSGLGLEDYKASKTTDLRNGQNTIINLFQEFTWKINKRTTLSQKLNYFNNIQDSDIYDYNFSTALRTRLTDVFGLELSYRKDFDSEVDGKQKDDTQWRSALVIYF